MSDSERLAALEQAVEWQRQEIARLRARLGVETDACADCHGTGTGDLISSERHGAKGKTVFAKCKRCNGHKRHTVVEPKEFGGERHTSVECGLCKGTGRYRGDEIQQQAKPRRHCCNRHADNMACDCAQPCPECNDSGYAVHPQNGSVRNARRCSRGCKAWCSVCNDPNCSNPSGQH